jgi:outer membrane protein TolC
LSGTKIEASQRFGYQDNNSIYFVPAPQGTARLALSLTQPLLQGAGRAYNQSVVVLAEIDESMARDQFSKDLQALLLRVHQAYWDLHLQRAALLQRRRLYAQASEILRELEARQGVDVLGSQLVRARAAVANREAAIIRYETEVRNAQSRLLALINDPGLACAMVEVIPAQPPSRGYLDAPLKDSLCAALQNRPELRQAAKEIRAASLRADVSKKELLPVLNFILGTYVSGLRGDASIGDAWGDQFSMGRPTYSAGLLFDVPYGNRAAKARLQQRRVEVRQMTNQLQATVANVRAEVEIAVREVQTTYREMASKYQAMQAEQAAIEYLVQRWRLLPGDDQAAGVVLDDLLDAQERLTRAEFDFAHAQVAYNVALIARERVVGSLLDYEMVTEIETCQGNLPTLLLGRPVQGKPSAPPASPAATAPLQATTRPVPQPPTTRNQVAVPLPPVVPLQVHRLPPVESTGSRR